MSQEHIDAADARIAKLEEQMKELKLEISKKKRESRKLENAGVNSIGTNQGIRIIKQILANSSYADLVQLVRCGEISDREPKTAYVDVELVDSYFLENYPMYVDACNFLEEISEYIKSEIRCCEPDVNIVYADYGVGYFSSIYEPEEVVTGEATLFFALRGQLSG